MADKKPIPQKRPFHYADYDEDDVYALQALAKGNATQGQQQRALNWILEASGVRDLSYRPDDVGGDRDTAFAEGKRFIGLQVARLLNIRYRPNLPTNTAGIPVGREPKE